MWNKVDNVGGSKMGVWMIGTGNISIKPQVEENLLKEFIQFSKSCYPEDYGEDASFNTWFFDENNKLFSIAGIRPSTP